jgi:hypothetical protein
MVFVLLRRKSGRGQETDFRPRRRRIIIYSPTYYERFKDAFVSEVNTFVDCCLNDKRKSLTT